MADTSAMAEIRGIFVDKVVKGFANEATIFKNYVTKGTTDSREVRWYQKPNGFLEATSPAKIDNVPHGAGAYVLEQNWTRRASHVRKYFVESPVITDEDIKDSDVTVLRTNIEDLTRAVAYKVDARIWDVLTEGQTAVNINEVTVTHEWDDPTNAKPITDILNAKKLIRQNGYDPEGGTLFLNSATHTSLMAYLIEEKGSSIPGFSSEKVVTGTVMQILGVNVVVSENVTSDYACLAQGERAVTWRSFIPITATTKEDPGIGKIIRVWEEGEAILTDPKAVTLLSNVGPS